MVTEVMGFLILIGVLVLLLVRQSMGRRKQLEDDRIEIQEGTDRLKAELEKTGNEIIERIESHVIKLESLLKEAEQGNRALDRRLTELQNALRRGAQIRESLSEIQQELEQARIDLEQETTKAQRVINVSRRVAASVSSMGVPSQLVVAQPTANYQQLPSAQSTPVQPQVNIPLGQSQQSQPQPQQIQPVSESIPKEIKEVEKISEIDERPKPVKIPRKNEADAFARVLQDSIDKDVDEDDELDLPADDEFIRDEKISDSPDKTETLKDISKDSARAKELLQSGWSVEEVARETGLGRGALELMKKMTPNK